MLLYVLLTVTLFGAAQAACGMSQEVGVKGCLVRMGLPDHGQSPEYIYDNCENADVLRKVVDSYACWWNVALSCAFPNAGLNHNRDEAQAMVDGICAAKKSQGINRDCLARALKTRSEIFNCYSSEELRRLFNRQPDVYHCKAIRALVDCVVRPVSACHDGTGKAFRDTLEARVTRHCNGVYMGF